MKYVMVIFMLVILLVGCAPSGNAVPTQPQTPVAVDNKSASVPPIAAQPSDNQTTQVVAPTTSKDTVDATDNALKSTVLIFSTNQWVMDEAKDAFWYEISMLRPILSNKQAPLHWNQNKMQQTWRQGSGILIDKNGYILTNRNVIEDGSSPSANSFGAVGLGAQLIYVFVPDENGIVNVEQGREYIATVICKHPQDDLAVIKITPRNAVFPNCIIGNSTLVKRSQSVTIIGYPSSILYMQSLSAYKWKTDTIGFTCEPTLTDGVVSAKNKLDTYPVNYTMDELNADYAVNVIQTTAAINYGSGGGPLVDSNGHLIGIAVAKVFGNDGLGFAIAIDDAKDLIKAALARPIEGIPDGSFLSCNDNGYCCSQSALESSPVRRCNQLCDNYYGKVQGAYSKCCQACTDNTH